MSNVLDRLRNSHHEPARLFAAGFTVAEVALQTDRSEASIENLTADPAFRGLVAFYRNLSNGNDG